MVEANRIGLRSMCVYAVCMSLFLNIDGIDPADYLILVSILLNLAPIYRIIVQCTRKPMQLFGISAFFASYALSSFVGGFNASFVTNFIINVFLFIVLASHCTNVLRMKRVVIYLSLGFGLSVVVASFQAFNLLPMLPGQFDVVRHSRFLGLYGDPNLLGASAVFFGIYWLDSMISHIERSSAYSVIATTLFVTSVLTLVFTLSRSAWGGFFIAVFVYSLRVMKGLRWRTALRVAGIGLVLLFVVLSILHATGGSETIEKRLRTASNIEDDAEEERFGLLYTAVALGVAATNPLGVGPGNTAGATGLISQDGGPIGAHNAFVQVAAENGWIAGLLFFYFVASLLRSSLKYSIQGVSALGMSPLVIFSSLISFVFCGLFQDLIQWKVVWIVPALYAAMIIHGGRRA